MVELWLECYLLELPFETGVPDRFLLHVKDDWVSGDEKGWEGFPLGDLLQLHPPPGPGMRSTTLEFRSAQVHAPSGIPVIEAAYPEVVANSRLGAEWWRRLLLRTEAYRYWLWKRAPREPRSVVRATRIDYAPPGGVDDGEWRGGQITKTLHELNEYLRAVAGVSQHPAVGPVSATQLPPLLFGYRLRLPAWFESDTEMFEHFAVMLHEVVGWSVPSLSREDADVAMRISGLQEEIPFMRPTQWHDMGRRSYRLETYEPTVMETGIAIELFVSEVVRRCGPLVGYSEDKITNILNGPFASRVKDHFAKLLGYDSHPETGQDALGEWWREGYNARNQLVHRGRRPTPEQAHQALLSADELLYDGTRRVQADPRFVSLLGSA